MTKIWKQTIYFLALQEKKPRYTIQATNEMLECFDPFAYSFFLYCRSYTCKFLLDRRGQIQNDTRNGIKQQNLRKK